MVDFTRGESVVEGGVLDAEKLNDAVFAFTVDFS